MRLKDLFQAKNGSPLKSGYLIEQGSNSEAAISEESLAVSATQLHWFQLFYCCSVIKETHFYL